MDFVDSNELNESEIDAALQKCFTAFEEDADLKGLVGENGEVEFRK